MVKLHFSSSRRNHFKNLCIAKNRMTGSLKQIIIILFALETHQHHWSTSPLSSVCHLEGWGKKRTMLDCKQQYTLQIASCQVHCTMGELPSDSLLYLNYSTVYRILVTLPSWNSMSSRSTSALTGQSCDKLCSICSNQREWKQHKNIYSNYCK